MASRMEQATTPEPEPEPEPSLQAHRATDTAGSLAAHWVLVSGRS